MPGYPFLGQRKLDYPRHRRPHEDAARSSACPTRTSRSRTRSSISSRKPSPTRDGAAAVPQRYPKAQVRKFDGKPGDPTELDAVIAYLQMLGTLVDFAKYDASGPNLR